MAIEIKGDNLKVVGKVEELMREFGGNLVDYDIGVCGWEVLGVSDGALLNAIADKFKEDGVVIVRGNMHSGSKVLCY